MCLIQTHCNSVQVVIETVPLESDHNSSRPNSGQKLWTSQLVSSLNSCGALSFVDPSLFSSSLFAKRSIAFSCQAVHLVLVIPESNKLSNFALKFENHEVERQWAICRSCRSRRCWALRTKATIRPIWTDPPSSVFFWMAQMMLQSNLLLQNWWSSMF